MAALSVDEVIDLVSAEVARRQPDASAFEHAVWVGDRRGWFESVMSLLTDVGCVVVKKNELAVVKTGMDPREKF